MSTTTRIVLAAAAVAAALAAPARADLPPDRALEQVTPTHKNGGDAVIGGALATQHAFVSPGEGRLAYDSFGAYAGAPSGYLNQYLAERTPAGWVSKPLTPRQGVPNFPDFTIGFHWFACAACSSVLGNFHWAADPLDDNGVSDAYVTTGDQHWTRVSVGSLPNAEGGMATTASDDGRVIGFVSTAALESAAVGTTPATPIAYLRAGGVTTPVAQRPDGTMLNLGGSAIGHESVQVARWDGAISPDGDRVYFESPLDGSTLRHVYVRGPGGQITQIDAPQCSQACAPATADASWVGASGDGTIAYFISNGQLLDDAPAGLALYAYDGPSGTLELLAAQPGPTGDNMDAGLWAASDDGARVYVTSTTVLTSAPSPAGVVAQAGSNNTYLIEGDRVEFLGRGEGIDYVPVLETSPNGRFATLTATTRLAPEYGGGTPQWYRYDAEQDTTVCLSCGDGPDQQLNADYRTPPAGPSDRGDVVFSTLEPLDPRDDNGRFDAYLYQEGEPYLLSSGQGTNDSHAFGLSRDGRDAYFSTFDALLASDIDGNNDIYDARIGGGFAVPPPRLECEGDGCQPITPPTDLPAVGSVTFTGAGNAPSRPVVSIRRSVRGSVATLRVRVPRPGTITASGSDVRRVRRAAGKAGTYTLRVRLDRAARRALRRNGKVRTDVTLRFAPDDGAAVAPRVAITFKKGGR